MQMETGQKTVIIEVDDLAQVELWEAWRQRYGAKAEISENEGCGCCVDIFRVRGDLEYLNSLPDDIVSYELSPEMKSRLEDYRKREKASDRITEGISLFRSKRYREATTVLSEQKSNLTESQNRILEYCEKHSRQLAARYTASGASRAPNRWPNAS